MLSLSMDTKKPGLIDRIKKIKGLEYIVIGIIAILIVVIILSDNLFESKSKSKSGDGVTEYVSSLESRLATTLSGVKGAGKVSVAISVAGGNKTIIATDVTTTKNGTELQTTESAVLVGGKVVVLGETYPEITGVVIVASGASDPVVKMNLLSAAETFLSVDSAKVKIFTGK